jgi:uncharacterized protein with FMN-binding domain
MKKFIVSGIFLIIFAAYAINQYIGGNAAEVNEHVATNATAPSSGDSNEMISDTATNDPDSVDTPVDPASVDQGASQNKYADGTFTGPVTDAIYGNMQVAVTIEGSKITNVTPLIYPNDRPQTVEINSHALPLLKSEAIQIQSAKVSVVSGATQSSEAYAASLAGALQKASS